ncbi:BCCT family transporter [Desulfobacterales bacterium HSG17]|nr:BCCT family transporter [Desulfobacterales bacterium HSG17]
MSSIATILALITIGLWSFLAYLGASLNNVPPFLLAGIALSISGLVGAIRFKLWKVPLKTLAMGVCGIFGYNFLYFFALQNAPAIEASLINYLWPLLIVVLSPVILSGYKLRSYHLISALAGLIGAGLIVTGGHLNLDMANLPGYLFAAGAALTWSCYSLFTKKVPPFSTAAVGAFCLISGILSLGIHFIMELTSTSLELFDNPGWTKSWTVFYWAWWVAWAPFVGAFIAKISRGRTNREFILVVMIAPPLFSYKLESSLILWIYSVFLFRLTKALQILNAPG